MIRIRGLNYSYKKSHPVLNQLNMEFHSGTIYGLLGKNGTGKSTLIKNITGLLFPTSGECEVFGHFPKKREVQFLKELYFVPEDYYLPNISIKGLVSIYKDFYPRFDQAQFQGYLDVFAIDAARTTGSLSLGQKKKILIGFALATNTRVLIMDEPTNGLDIPSKILFRQMIQESFNKDRILIITSHQVRDLDELIHHIIIMNEGRILLDTNKQHIAKKLEFQLTAQSHNTTDCCYHEQLSHGYASIRENKHDNESYVDIEVLFNAVLKDANNIKNLL